MSGVVVERAGFVESVHRGSVTSALGSDVEVIRADLRLERHG